VLEVSLVTAGLLAGVLVLIPWGFRDGERAGDAHLLGVAPLSSRELAVTMRNPGPVPVLVGLSLRRPGLRVRLEGGVYVRIGSQGQAAGRLPGRQAVLGVLEPRAVGTFVVRLPAGVRNDWELVAVVGQQERLRTIHRLVRIVHSRTGEVTRGSRVRRYDDTVFGIESPLAGALTAPPAGNWVGPPLDHEFKESHVSRLDNP
jgi:hypothetical protein